MSGSSGHSRARWQYAFAVRARRRAPSARRRRPQRQPHEERQRGTSSGFRVTTNSRTSITRSRVPTACGGRARRNRNRRRAARRRSGSPPPRRGGARACGPRHRRGHACKTPAATQGHHTREAHVWRSPSRPVPRIRRASTTSIGSDARGHSANRRSPGVQLVPVHDHGTRDLINVDVGASHALMMHQGGWLGPSSRFAGTRPAPPVRSARSAPRHHRSPHPVQARRAVVTRLDDASTAAGRHEDAHSRRAH